MKAQRNILTSLLKIAACGILLLGMTARADDAKADPVGTWTWTTQGRNGGPDRTNTLTLKVDAAKVTGKVASPGRGGKITETEISDGKVDGSTLTFAVVREFNGNSRTNSYSGKISADKITGKMEFTNGDGEKQSRDWVAKRSDDKPAESK